MSLKVIALIATCDRFELLAQRALPSVLNQTYPPDHLIIVDDSRDEKSFKFEIFASKVPKNIEFTYLKNTRTRGASGAWNTGLIYAAENFGNPKDIYIAILDDDDEWAANHLEKCIACTPQNDMAISGLVRHDENGVHHDLIPDKLDIVATLIGNPGIQGSNLLLRLSSFLESGLFDENLLSSTDRDLCIRLAEIGISATSTEIHTVHHYADPDRSRLSSFGAPDKMKSLQTFWQKYHCRMNSDQKKAFLSHSKTIFGFSPKNFQKTSLPANNMKAPDFTPFHLIVGVISADATQLSYLLKDLCIVQSFHFITDLDVLIMSNGGDEKALLDLSAKMLDKRLHCYFISQKQQTQDAATGSFGKPFKRGIEQLSIGKARTLLQRYLAEFVKQKTDAIAWVLDDDMQLDERAQSYLAWLPEFKKIGVDILLGTYEGSSPNPATSGMRVQLVDLLNNMEWLYSLDPNESLPDRSEENRKLRMMYHDYYYDLSRLHTAHLETVYWLTPDFQGETVAEAKHRLISNVTSLFTGSSLLRPVIVNMPFDPIKEAQYSLNRGGTTFIFSPLALKKTPNATVDVSGKDARRSDMMWAFINRYYYGLKIMRANFPIIHNRNVAVTPKLNLEKTVGELQGSTLHAALKDVMGSVGQHDFEFDKAMKTVLCKKFGYYLDKRLSSFRLSFYRIQGLCKALKRFDQRGELSEFIESLSGWYTNSTLETITSEVKALSEERIYNFLDSLKVQIENYADSKLSIAFLDNQKLLITEHLEQS